MGNVRRILRSPLLWAVGVAVVAGLPWWRNHSYLRDFYDYGLVVAGNTRITTGERPYVDFTTPIQSGIFWLNLAAERLGGGGYLAMTRGAAVLIVLSGAGFTLMLARRWPVWLAALAAGAITLGSASQHTIVWHNTLGVACLALVAWSTALAPVWRRQTWPWHLATLAGLMLGGVNKLNFHLVALAVAGGWAVYAWRVRGESLGRTAVTVGVWVCAGTLIPWSIEVAWTGATWSTWFYNVAQLASGSRAGELARILTVDFYLQPTHDYYGALRLPQIGAVGVFLALVAGAAVWRAAPRAQRPWWARIFAVGGALLTFGIGAALIATNFEIAYVGLSAWVVLAVSLWLGFAAPVRGRLSLGLATVLGLLAVFGGESAWRGQRSQFGHSADPRGSYVDAATAGPAFHYVRGLRVPVAWVQSFRAVAAELPAQSAQGLRPVFYGPGIEWMERIFPAAKHRGLPLWAHWRTSYSDRELEQLERLIGQSLAFEALLTPVAWDHWDASVRGAVEMGFSRRLIGPLVAVRHSPRLRILYEDAFGFIESWGGNTALTAWDSGKVMVRYDQTTRRVLLGRAEGETVLSLREPVNRIAGEVVVHRVGTTGRRTTAEFTLQAPGESVERWWVDVTLEPGEREKRVPYDLEVGGQRLDFKVRVAPEFAGEIFGGFSGPRVLHAGGPTPEQAAALRPTNFALSELSAATLNSSLPDRGVKLERVLVRGGRWRDGAMELPPAGELWLQFDRPLASLEGRVFRAERDASSPVLRTAWTRGARIEVMTQAGFPPGEQEMPFKLWSPEEGGWFVFTVDPSADAGPVLIRLERLSPANY